MATSKKNFVIRFTQAGNDRCYVKLSSPYTVEIKDADKFTEKQAHKCIEDMSACGEWVKSHFSVIEMF